MTPLERAAFDAACAYHKAGHVDHETATAFIPVVEAALLAIHTPIWRHVSIAGNEPMPQGVDDGFLGPVSAGVGFRAVLDQILSDGPSARASMLDLMGGPSERVMGRV